MQVRHGTWHDLPAAYKIWDLGDSLEPLLNMQAEVDAYSRMLSLQASSLVTAVWLASFLVPVIVLAWSGAYRTFVQYTVADVTIHP